MPSWSGGRTCWPGPIAVSAPGLAIPRSVGLNSRPWPRARGGRPKFSGAAPDASRPGETGRRPLMEPRSDAVTTGAAVAAPPRLSVRKLAPAIGAEIEGVDLSRPLDAATVAALRRAWHDHAVILLRDQHLAEEDQIRFGECFGTLGRVFTRRDGRHPAIRHHALRHRGAVTGRRYDVRQHVCGLRCPLRGDEGEARAPARRQLL